MTSDIEHWKSERRYSWIIVECDDGHMTIMGHFFLVGQARWVLKRSAESAASSHRSVKQRETTPGSAVRPPEAPLTGHGCIVAVTLTSVYPDPPSAAATQRGVGKRPKANQHV